MHKAAYRLHLPKERTTSVLFNSPHSGRDYPWTFLRESILDERTIRSSEDAFVDLLFANAPLCGAPLLAATSPRAYVDLNRSADELDPALIEGVRKTGHNPRVNSGLGVIPRVVANGRAIRSGKMPLAEAEDRLRNVWFPYHAKLQALLDENLAQFGEAILIDCHSMPHEAIESISRGKSTPQVVLGDRFGAASNTEIVDRVQAIFEDAGLRVARNSPFAGAYITQHYGRPSKRQHAIQIELDRSLYMDEVNVCPGRDFKGMQTLIASVVDQITEIGRVVSTPLAAE